MTMPSHTGGEANAFLRARRPPRQVVKAGWAAALGMASIAASWAQVIPPTDPTNQLIRQQQQQEALQQRMNPSQSPAPIVVPRPPNRRLPLDEPGCVQIHRYDLTGTMSKQLQWAKAAAEIDDEGQPDSGLGRCLGEKGTAIVRARVLNAIIAQYPLTQFGAPLGQAAVDGVLTMEVIPGRLRAIRIMSESPPVTLWNIQTLERGQVITTDDYDQFADNLRRLPTVASDMRFAPAAPSAQYPGPIEPGESEIRLDWVQSFPLRLNLALDNSGTKATGKYQGAVTVAWDNPLRLNDLFYASYNHDLGGGDDGERGTRGHVLHYSIPYRYWLLSLTTSQSRFHQSVAGINQTYLYSGENRNHDVTLSHILFRDGMRKTTLSASAWMRTSNNFIDDTEIGIQRRRMAGWTIQANHRQHFSAATALDLTLGYRRGTSAWDAMPAPEELAGTGTSRPRILTAEARLEHAFALAGQTLRYVAGWRAQWNRTPLVPQDRFAIGGRYTVRGFDGESLLSAERGWLIRNDLEWTVAEGQALYLGMDCGMVSGPTSALLVGTRLCGGVLGWKGQWAHVPWYGRRMRLSYNLFAGGPLKKPPGFTTSSTTAGFTVNAEF